MPGENVYLNGMIVPADEARISVFDSGFLHGASAFTTMLAHNGRVFRLERHVARLAEAVAALGLQADVATDDLADAVANVLSANQLADARVRITLSPGSRHGGSGTVIVSADELPEYPARWFEQGLDVVVAPFRQVPGDPTVGRKTGCYLPRLLALRHAATKQADEALWFTPENLLAEACFCNVFLVVGGVVRTPPLDTPVLAGTVREVVLELCSSLGMPHEDRSPLTIREVLAAEEVFLTASTRGICPVARVERHAIGEEKPGPVTQRLRHAYAELLERECPPDAAGGAAEAPAPKEPTP